jgi:AraC-like DNA-binding protein
LHEDITGIRLADVSGCHKPVLWALFNESLGMGPMAWVKRRKIEEATRLLADGELSVREIARKVGYAHQQSFFPAVPIDNGIDTREISREFQIPERGNVRDAHGSRGSSGDGQDAP